MWALISKLQSLKPYLLYNLENGKEAEEKYRLEKWQQKKEVKGRRISSEEMSKPHTVKVLNIFLQVS